MTLRIIKDKFGIPWYVDDELKGTEAFIWDKGHEEKKKEQKKKE